MTCVRIAQADSALRRDPGSAYLNQYLAATMQRKLKLLRRAVGALGADGCCNGDAYGAGAQMPSRGRKARPLLAFIGMTS